MWGHCSQVKFIKVACAFSFIPLLPRSLGTSRGYLCAIMKRRFGTKPWNSTSLRPAYVIGVSCYQNPVTTRAYAHEVALGPLDYFRMKTGHRKH